MKRILVVDDFEGNRELLSDFLGEVYEVETAANGQEAIDRMIAGEKYALVLLDLVMPVVDGFGVLEYRAKHHLEDDYPVIIISGDSGVETESRCFDYAISDFIAKPFKEKVVLKRVGNLIALNEAVSKAYGMILRGECGKFGEDIMYCFQLARYEFFNAVEHGFSYVDAGRK